MLKEHLEKKHEKKTSGGSGGSSSGSSIALNSGTFTFSVIDDEDATPLIGLGTTTGGVDSKPCWDSGVSNKVESELSYPFSTIKATGCGSYGTIDDCSTDLDNALMKDVYDANDITKTLTNIPDYSSY